MMKRWALNIFVGLSALLFVATVGLWIRSYWCEDSAVLVRKNGWLQDYSSDADPHYILQSTSFLSAQGRVVCANYACQFEGRGSIIWADHWMHDQRTSLGWHWHESLDLDKPATVPPVSIGNGFGFYIDHKHVEEHLTMGEEHHSPPRQPGMDWGTEDARWVYVPYWPMTLLLGTIPTVWLIFRYRREWPADSCRKCGYNLTSNISGICPECGTAIERAKA